MKTYTDFSLSVFGGFIVHGKPAGSTEAGNEMSQSCLEVISLSPRSF